MPTSLYNSSLYNTFFLVPPQIISFPSKWNAIEGRNISAICEASGKPAPDIIWLRNGSPLKNMPQSYDVGKLATDNRRKSRSTLTLSPARRSDNAKYGCQAKNDYGEVIQSVTLKLMCKYQKITSKL